VLQTANHVICDSQSNYDLVNKIGIDKNKFPLGVVSGTGGMDIRGISQGHFREPYLQNRVVIWPKAYEAISSKATPVFEAINLAWESIKPVKFIFLWMEQEELKLWMKKTLYPEIMEHVTIYGRLPRDRVFDLLVKADVLLAPSLMDGIPNSMLEAMTLGVLPIVSPLTSIKTLVNEKDNVLFARNLYPEEIASALKEALTPSPENQRKIINNFDLIRKNYDREQVAQRVIQFYNNCD
jgi:hypothetical protein